MLAIADKRMTMLSLVSLLIIFAALPWKGQCYCGRNKFRLLNACCEMCPPGHYVTQNCTKTRQTNCTSCEVGTFMNVWNRKTKCDHCPSMHYYDLNLSYCMKCKACPKGQYPALKCSKTRNSECMECPENHYSNVTENQDSPCIVCTRCKSYRRRCTRVQDSICSAEDTHTMESPKTPTTPTTPTTIPSTKKIAPNLTTEKTRHTKKNAQSTSKDIIMILAIVFSTFIVLVSLGVYWCARKKSRCQGGTLSGSSHGATKYVPLETGMLLRNQPAHLFLRLVELLNPEGRPNWKDLAAEFRDFSYDEIANFAVDKSTAAEKMLGAWQTKNSATLDKLHKSCMSIRREDVATMIEEYAMGTHTTPV